MKKWSTLFFVCAFSCSAEEFRIHDNALYTSELPSIQRLDDAIALTSEGVEYFFTHIFPHVRYCQDILPHTFDHLIQLLQYGKQTRKGTPFDLMVWRTFAKGVRASLYIQAEALERLLQELVQEDISGGPALERLQSKHHITDLLYNRFLKEFEVFKQDPESFFDRLADDIMVQLTNKLDNAQLLTTYVLFFEICVNALAWSPQDEVKTFKTLISLADLLSRFLSNVSVSSGVISDLCTSLVLRYCFFLELMRNEFSTDCLVALKEAVTHESTPWLNTFIIGNQTHREYLLRVITTLEAHTRAGAYGYVSLETKQPQVQQKTQVSSVLPEIKREKRPRRRNRKRNKGH